MQLDQACKGKERARMLSEEECIIKPGEMARVDNAIFNGNWCTWYCCIPCMDKWFDETEICPSSSTPESEKE